MAQRLREALPIALRLRAGESVAEVRRGLRMPARAAERFVADVARSDPDRLRRALCALAELELDSRGGALLVAAAARRWPALRRGHDRAAGDRDDHLAAQRRSAERRSAAGEQASGAGLLVGARVAVQRAALDGLVDRALQAHVLGLGGRASPLLHGRFEVAEVGLDRRGVAAVLEALALGAQDALLLGMMLAMDVPAIVCRSAVL